MSNTTRLGLGVLGAALALGVLGDALLRATPWGVNVPLWTGALVAATVALARWGRIAATGDGRWLVFPALFFAAALAWRDSGVLTGLNLLALLVALGLFAFRARAGRLRVAGAVDYALGLLVVGLSAALASLALVFGDIKWKEAPRSGWSGRLAAAGKGILIAAPLLVLFGGLFVAADAVFGGLVAGVFGWDAAELMSHLFLAAFCAWIAGGFLRQALIGQELQNPVGECCPRLLSLGIIELGIVLGSLNALFLAFVIVQFRYFFGGAALVEASTDLTYAEYARRGFFELVTVAALVLPLLLVAEWVLRKDSLFAVRVVRALAGSLVGMLFIIMYSAVRRMLLYQREFGLTELRLYTTAFMAWLAVVFVWFLLTVLRGRRMRFAFGALVAGFVAVAVLNSVNPDALIVRTNVGRISVGRGLDTPYAASLSADAAPALVEALPRLMEAERRPVAAHLLRRWSVQEGVDWRTWNWGRSQARESVDAHRVALQGMAQGYEDSRAGD